MGLAVVHGIVTRLPRCDHRGERAGQGDDLRGPPARGRRGGPGRRPAPEPTHRGHRSACSWSTTTRSWPPSVVDQLQRTGLPGHGLRERRRGPGRVRGGPAGVRPRDHRHDDAGHDGGRAGARSSSASGPDIPVILCSGYSERITSETAPSAGDRRVRDEAGRDGRALETGAPGARAAMSATPGAEPARSCSPRGTGAPPSRERDGGAAAVTSSRRSGARASGPPRSGARSRAPGRPGPRRLPSQRT